MLKKDDLALEGKEGHTTKVRVLDRQPMSAGNSEIIEKLTVVLTASNSNKERIIYLVVKRINNVRRTEEEKANKTPLSDIWLDRWQKLKSAGIPVVPMVRRLDDERVAMTDLTADGSEVYGKADMTASRGSRALDILLGGVDLEILQQQAQSIAKQADEHELLLADDDALSLVMHPDGSWRLMALDIGHTQVKKEFAKKVHPSWLENRNSKLVLDIINYVNALKHTRAVRPIL